MFAIQMKHVTAIITRVYHGVLTPLYLLGWQVPNTMYQGEEIALGLGGGWEEVRGAPKRALPTRDWTHGSL